MTLSIVGRAPTPAACRLAADPGVIVTGRVDDVRPFMRAGGVYIVPLRIGGGTRLKIFEAMAMGKAVVSTAVGAEGLPVTAGDTCCSPTSPRVRARSRPRCCAIWTAPRDRTGGARPGGVALTTGRWQAIWKDWCASRGRPGGAATAARAGAPQRVGAQIN